MPDYKIEEKEKFGKKWKNRKRNFIRNNWKLQKKIDFYKDPVYTVDEKTTIKNYEDLALSFYNDLKKDGYLKTPEDSIVAAEDKRIIKFYKIPMNISNKLVNTEIFDSDEQWFILISLYCWYCEMIKNLLLKVISQIY